MCLDNKGEASNKGGVSPTGAYVCAWLGGSQAAALANYVSYE